MVGMSKEARELVAKNDKPNLVSYLKKLYGSLGGDPYSYSGPSPEDICKKIGLEKVPSRDEVLRLHSEITSYYMNR